MDAIDDHTHQDIYCKIFIASDCRILRFATDHEKKNGALESLNILWYVHENLGEDCDETYAECPGLARKQSPQGALRV